MNLQKKSLLNKTFKEFMDIGLGQKNMARLKQIVTPDISGFGTAIDEKTFSFPELQNLLKEQKRQSKGIQLSWKIKPLHRHITADENSAVFMDDLVLKTGTAAGTMKMYMRISVVLEFRKDKWLVTHWHGSKPENVQSEEDTFGIESWKQKAEELEKLVKERTAELVEKNRELEIETSLERVRSRMMAMHHTSELQEVIHTVHMELLNLNISIDGGSFIAINKDIDTQLRCWGSGGTADTSEEVVLPVYKKPFLSNIINGIKKGPGFFTEEFTQQQKKEFFNFLFKHEPWSKLSAKQKKETLSAPGGYTRSCCVSKHTSIFIINHLGKKFSEAGNDILKRFGKVFEQTYTRFLELQKAEAQARESQIQLALERVRARTMAMHNSNELGEVAVLLFEQIKQFGIENYASGFNIWDEEHKNVISWMSNPTNSINPPFEMPIHSFAQHEKIYKAWKNHETFLEDDINGKNLVKHYQFIRSFPLLDAAFKKAEAAGIKTPNRQVHNVAFFSKGYLLFITLEPKPEFHDLFKRFAQVFEQTYTRFLDLQNAEAQARESQIQLALERARAQSMIMQHSRELDDTLRVFHEQVLQLGIHSAFSFLWLPDEEKDRHIFWAAWAENNSTVFKSKAINYPLDRDEPATAQCLVDWKSNQPVISYHVPPQGIENYFAAWSELIAGVEELKSENFSDGVYYIEAFMKYGCFGVMVKNELPEDEKKILGRFAIEFERAYTRFLDLQKAEAQSRESQIQLALERVRARTMAMQKSNELTETAGLLFNQITDLGIKTWTVGFNVWSEDNNTYEDYITSPKGGFIPPYIVDTSKASVLKEISDARKSGNPFFVQYAEGERLRETYIQLAAFGDEKQYEKMLEDGVQFPSHQYNHLVFGSKVSLLFITYEPVPEAHDIFKRFGQVFEQTYTRFLDLQKAEAQAREAQIEAALEKVRSRSLAMYKSDELKEVIKVVLEQFIHLKINVQHAGFYIDYKAQDDMHIWLADPNLEPFFAIIPYFDTPTWNSFLDAKAKGIPLHTDLLNFEEKNNFYQSLFKLFTIPEEAKQFYMQCKGLAVSTVLLDNVGLYIENFSAIPYTDEENNILMRFGKVFQQTYTRFLDLQKAEAQTRESQIQLALERVRAKTMAMQKSEELNSAASEMFKLIQSLGIQPWACGFNIFDKNEKAVTQYMSLADGGISPPFRTPLTEDTFFINIYNARQRKDELLVMESKGESLAKTYQYMFSLPGSGEIFGDLKNSGFEMPKFQITHCAYFSQGYLVFITYNQVSEAHDIFKRFAKVFEQTYTRFLDLQKAEAQAREAQIEAALERVRSKSLAMKKSEDLRDIVKEVMEQFQHLGVQLEGGGVHIQTFNEATGEAIQWSADPMVNAVDSYIIPYNNDPVFADFLKAKRAGENFFYHKYSFEEKNRWFDWAFVHTDFKNLPEEFKRMLFGCESYAHWAAIQNNSAILINNILGKSLSENQIDILKRFSIVFEQSFVRFLDLQKAEEQAREAQIEAALERVRGRTMAMQQSSELLPTAEIMFDQLKQLGAELQGVAFAICDENSTMVQKWTSIGNFSHPYNIEPGEQRMYEAWKNQSGMYEEEYEGEKQKKYYELFMQIPEFRQGLQKVIDMGFPIPAWQKNYAVPFKNGYVLFIITKPFNETQIFLRFGKVFEQTYTRFLDLQKSETATKEAIKQAALDRIRADIASMRTTKDLERITPLIWNELSILGIPFVRCGVFIMDEDEQLINTFLSTPEGKAIAAIQIPYSTPGKIRLIPENWKKGTAYTDHWNDSDFSDFAHALVQNHVFESSEQYLAGIPHGGFYLHFLPFLQGMMYVGNATQLNDVEINLIQAVADAFSSAFSRYEDFNKLEAAKKQVDSTLTELQATQKQLIQSEKMASLGELTAGIAHEIQNPLNFVNNFSEVSTELVDEMNAEITKGNIEDAIEIANDLKQNLEKINHHGKRAGDIVKGMLQHSRKSEGQREPTDINALCDEYLRLSYHGMRAKDKSFNADVKTDFDSSLPKLNVVPQDIGRVILNLINNAFYAVNEKGRANTGFVPQVTIVTKKLNDNIQISVKDNGNGIPRNIVDKIFQPFFTTKPTGQGTGLGLSLSYDIVKAHGGEIKVETKEGEGSEFIILILIA